MATCPFCHGHGWVNVVERDVNGTPSVDGPFNCDHCAGSGTVLSSVSSAILTPDPDKGTTTMTSFPAPEIIPEPFTGIVALPEDPQTHPVPIALSRTVDGHDETLHARDAAAVTTLLNKAAASPVLNSFVQKARTAEATGAVGLYIEAVVHTSAGKPFSHMRFFVIDKYLYVYNRSIGDTRANWKLRSEESLAHALALVQKSLEKSNVKMFGHPVLVELTADDLSAVEAGAMPPARFRGAYRIERDYGRYDFEMPVVTGDLPAKLVNLLRDPAWITATA